MFYPMLINKPNSIKFKNLKLVKSIFMTNIRLKSANQIRLFKTQSNSDSRSNKFKSFGKLSFILTSGIIVGSVAFYHLTNDIKSNKNIKKVDNLQKDNEKLDPSLDVNMNIDLNEVYEKTAVVFLSNPEVIFLHFFKFILKNKIQQIVLVKKSTWFAN